MLNRRQFLTSAAAFLESARRRPNIIIVFTDDQGYGDLGSYGATGYETPHFDRMAREGVKFTSFYSAAPVCTPSRAALLTGCYPIRVGLGHRVLFPYSVTGLDPDEVTIADMLKPHGYATGCIGKWHLGHLPKFLPTEQGFDYYYGVPYSNDMGEANYQQLSFKSPPLPVMRNKEIIERAPAQASLTGRFTEEAVRFIRQHANEPFFLYVPHCMPHTPLDASGAFKGKSAHGLYGDVIRELDWSMGEILAALQSQGIDDNTMVLFTSDNGPVVWEGLRRGYRSGSAGPLRGAKNSTWEGGMRVPCLARWPGRIRPGQVCDELATTMDILPTVAQLIGAQPPRDRIIDGRSIVPLLTGETGARTPHDRFYYYRDDRLEAVRSGDWKIHVHKPDWRAQSPPQLYNLRADIGETTDLAARQSEVVKRLQGLAAEAREELGDAVIRKVGRNVRPIGRIP